MVEADIAMTSGRGDELYERLRRVSVVDPKQARAMVCELLDPRSPELDELLRRASSPGEGRLRGLIANAVCHRPERSVLANEFAAWLAIETDEFARQAVAAALEGSVPAAPRTAPALVDAKLVVAYRYAADRLQHRLRNGLLDPMKHVVLLRSEIETLREPTQRIALEARLRELTDALDRFGRIVEFDTSDAYFEMRSVSLSDWLRTFDSEYARRHGVVRMRLEIPRESTRIRATGHLLYTIFWNLWINAQQAVDGECELFIHITRVRRRVDVLLIDNGMGLKENTVEDAFLNYRPGSPAHRGRGLLEVQEALGRLHATSTLIPQESGGFRIQLSFPAEGP